MDNISPLAKTLAESNGIDWRAIQGSGAGGQIVEQDIINYLTRVMSGEEEPPATPVDLPPPDWTGDELPAGLSAEMLSQAGVESDIAALVNQAPPAQAPAGQSVAGQNVAGQHAASVQSAQLEEDEFELEDEPAVEMLPEREPEPIGQPAPTQAQPMAGGLGGLLSQLYQSPSRPSQVSSTSSHQAAPVQEAPSAPAAQSPAVQSPAAQSPAAASAAPSTSWFTPGLGQRAPQSEVTEAEQVTEAERPATSDTPRFTDEPLEPAPQPTGPQVSAEPESMGEPEMLSEPARGDAEDAELVVSEASAPAEQEAVQAAAAVDEAEAVQESQAESAAPAAAPVRAPERPEQAVWFGAYLRRDADVQAVCDLRDQLNAALGQDVPLSLLVARAAQHHADMLGLSAVAIQDVYSQRARSVGTKGTGLRDALAATDRDHDGQPDLLVVNAGTFNLDELHYPDALTLSLGRVVDGRAALSLNGDVDTVQAAEFLAAVAASLEAPVALII